MQKVRVALLGLCATTFIGCVAITIASTYLLTNPMTPLEYTQHYVAPMIKDRFGLPVVTEDVTHSHTGLDNIADHEYYAEERAGLTRLNRIIDRVINTKKITKADALHIEVSDNIIFVGIEVARTPESETELKQDLGFLHAGTDERLKQAREELKQRLQAAGFSWAEHIEIVKQKIFDESAHVHNKQHLLLMERVYIGVATAAQITEAIRIAPEHEAMLVTWRDGIDPHLPRVSRTSMQGSIISFLVLTVIYLTPWLRRTVESAKAAWHERQARIEAIERAHEASAAEDAERKRIAAARRETKRLEKAQRASVSMTPRPAPKPVPLKIPKKLDRTKVLLAANDLIIRVNRLLKSGDYEEIAADIARERDLLQVEIDNLRAEPAHRKRVPRMVQHLHEHTGRTAQALSDLIASSRKAS